MKSKTRELRDVLYSRQSNGLDFHVADFLFLKFIFSE